jgi:putative ABC transport system ATP-binding protein
MTDADLASAVGSSGAGSDAPIVELRDVWKIYDTGSERVEALRGVDFAARAGEFVAVMGPSGSGKSTMLNVVGLLDSASEGTVLLDGRDVTGLSDREMTNVRKHAIGFIFQNFHLIPTLTALENVELPTLFGDDPTARDRAVDLLERVGLGDRLDHNPNQLSGGQKQRVAIARSLINQPRILLADEPTGNLDRTTGRSVLEEFERFCEEDDVTIIAVTHDPQVSNYADRTVYLVDGAVDTSGSWRPVGHVENAADSSGVERVDPPPDADAPAANADTPPEGDGDGDGGGDSSPETASGAPPTDDADSSGPHAGGDAT